jgi:pSer/pThr/pTyr-binding forkhead associated (FHA) protein
MTPNPNPHSAVTSRLVVTAPAALRGRVLSFGGERVVVGRQASSDLVLPDPSVSRAHAAVEFFNGGYAISDLGSAGGTTVNQRAVHDRYPLENGDSIRFASVEVRFEAAGLGEEKTLIRPDDVPFRGGSSRAARSRGDRSQGARSRGDQSQASFSVGAQRGEQVNNVGRDQYNHYVQQVRQERASFLEAVAGARTRARRLILLGFLLAVGGFGVYGWVVVRGVMSIFDLVSSASQSPDPEFSPDIPDLLGRKVDGIPIGIIGFAAAAVGTLFMVIGIVMHISATSRRRRGETEFTNALLLNQPPSPY